MRLWTLHPKYLDPQGLVALWREGLLARAVLRGATRGYRHHPQLQRFRASTTPVTSLNRYLAAVHREATSRGYQFDAGRLGPVRSGGLILETSGQLNYEWDHLLAKLRRRSPVRYRLLRNLERPEPHPLFHIVRGGVREWERGTSDRHAKL
ncbi:MAG TPA: pyrimidine dimer DNA glycosylase/endonuclease V [Gemmatimonadales bacterium]|nr:pyrimidine dimer DNA glycosylase/endonuclease V [Gemmatimonadales bacterium]